jgi:alkylated DNA repair dioxygenase AlkB
VLAHGDNESTLGGPVILSISLGGGRRFMVRPADLSESSERLQAHLQHGDLIVMSRDMQNRYLYAVPKTGGRPAAPRVNVTLRHYIGGIQVPRPQ